MKSSWKKSLNRDIEQIKKDPTVDVLLCRFTDELHFIARDLLCEYKDAEDVVCR